MGLCLLWLGSGWETRLRCRWSTPRPETAWLFGSFRWRQQIPKNVNLPHIVSETERWRDDDDAAVLDLGNHILNALRLRVTQVGISSTTIIGLFSSHFKCPVYSGVIVITSSAHLFFPKRTAWRDMLSAGHALPTAESHSHQITCHLPWKSSELGSLTPQMT